MARKKSELLGAYGTSFEIFKRIADAVIEAGGGDDDLRRVLSEDGLAGKLAQVIMTDGEKIESTGKVIELHKVMIHRDVSRDKRVDRMKLGWINQDFTTDRFPLPVGQPIERELGLLDMGRDFTLDEARVQAEKLGFELAETEDGVAYVTGRPELQKKNPIVVGGSRARDSYGSVVVPVFRCHNDNERNLRLTHDAYQFDRSDRVLVRRKSK